MNSNSIEVTKDREAMVNHPKIKELVKKSLTWPGYPLKRHNDANHPLHTLSVLADYGIKATDPGMNKVINKILSKQSEAGAFQTQIQLYKQFGGLEGQHWTWMACDATVLLYVLFCFGLSEINEVKKAKNHILSLIEENGWRCSASSLLGNFKGPGKREDPCPITNAYALKALSLDPDLIDDSRVLLGVEMLLKHWEFRGEKKYFLFGIGSDFQKLKYPLVWYDILHIADVLSRYPIVHKDPRFQEMVRTITNQADKNGYYTASSMFRAWKEWSFADKKNPSPWLTFMVYRILKRSGILVEK
jgi:hypothetical protein